VVVVSPDAGGVKRANKFRDLLIDEKIRPGLAVIRHALSLSCSLALSVSDLRWVCSKQRAAAGIVESMQLVGDVRGADAIIVGAAVARVPQGWV
jgi:phosphoribosylpyrophosphate synthetase